MSTFKKILVRTNFVMKMVKWKNLYRTKEVFINITLNSQKDVFIVDVLTKISKYKLKCPKKTNTHLYREMSDIY